MTRDELRLEVLALLTRIAPEADPAALRGDVSLRDQMDLDSIDFVNFIISIDHRLGVSIPEADYAQVMTLDGCIEYLERHDAAPRSTAPDV